MVVTSAIERIAGALCLLAVGASAIYVAKDLHETQTQIQLTVASLNATIQKVNNSYDSQAQSAIAIERDIRVEMWHVDKTLTTVDTTLKSIPPIVVALTETAHSASGTLQEAQTTIKGLQPLTEAATVSIQHLTPVEDESRQAVADFDLILKDDAIHRTLDDVAGMSDSGNHILFDFRRVADKTTEDYLKPVKWYMQPVKKFGDLWDIGAAVARHAP